MGQRQDSDLTTAATVVHLFSGLGGCTRGMQRAGWRTLMSIDRDAKACEQLHRWTGTPVAVRDIGLMQPVELRALVPESPVMLIMSPPCKSFSGCMPAARAAEERYVDMSQLAVRATFLALEAWDAPPGLILIENVPRIQSRGAPLLEQIVKLLHRYNYATNLDTHCCGEIGGGPQRRHRFMLVARHMPRVPAFLRKLSKKRLQTVGEAILHFPSPVAEHADPMHRMPRLSPLNWLRLAAIRAGRDWRDLPAEIQIGGGPSENRHAGKMGVEDVDKPAHTVVARGNRPGSGWGSVVDTRVGFGGPQTHSGILGLEDTEAPAHTVTGNARPHGTWGSVVDPRIGWDTERHGGRPDSFGVADLDRPSNTIRGRQEVQTSRRSVVDTRISNRTNRQNGGYGVEDVETPAHAVLAEGSVANTRASVVDTRLGCSPRSGAYGVQDIAKPAGAVLGHHAHDNAVGSVVDPRLAHEPRRGTFGVVDPGAPSPTIRDHHDARQAPAAVLDERGWPIPTHTLIRHRNGTFTLSGPEVDWASKRPCLMVIESVDEETSRRGWHRPMTPRELFKLQGGDDDFVVEGPRSSSKTQAGIIEWIGNMIPVYAAEAFGVEAMVCWSSSTPATFLRGPDVWVHPVEEARAS